MTPGLDEIPAAVDKARQLDKRAIAGLIRIFEDARPEAAATRQRVIELLADRDAGAAVLGVTGTPGSGKSSLIGRLVPELLLSDRDLTIGVLAVDPSSQVSRGALLGDRTRMRPVPDERRCYFRSQATATELGGLAPASYQVCRLLSHLFDAVLVETVGIGQSELDIRHLADEVFLVMQPLGGDEVQYLKAGIIEIPDAFVLNKCDEAAAERSYHQLQSSLSLARPADHDRPPVYRTSARTGQGIAELAAAMLDLVRRGPLAEPAQRDLHFLRRWVRDEWGRTGLRCVAADVGDLAAFYRSWDGFDLAQQALDATIRASVCGPRS